MVLTIYNLYDCKIGKNPATRRGGCNFRNFMCKGFDIFFKKRFSVIHINVAFTLEEYLAGYTSLLFSSIGSTLLILKEQMSTQSYTVM